MYFYHNKILDKEMSNIFINVITLGLSLLMVSKFKYPAFPKLTPATVGKNPWPFVLIIIAAIISLVTKGYAIFILCLMFVFGGMFWSMVMQLTRKKKQLERVIAKKRSNSKR
jgi:phosphatidylserine synthase